MFTEQVILEGCLYCAPVELGLEGENELIDNTGSFIQNEYFYKHLYSQQF